MKSRSKAVAATVACVRSSPPHRPRRAHRPSPSCESRARPARSTRGRATSMEAQAWPLRGANATPQGPSHQVSGASAVGLINGERVNALVNALYSVALIVRRIGQSGAFSASEAWLYEVNHGKPKRKVVDGHEKTYDDDTLSGDQYALENGYQVLWYFANIATGKNTGSEPEPRALARVHPNRPFGVRAYASHNDGDARPAGGVRIAGDANASTDARAWASVRPTRQGAFRLRGTRGNDIPREWTRGASTRRPSAARPCAASASSARPAPTRSRALRAPTRSTRVGAASASTSARASATRSPAERARATCAPVGTARSQATASASFAPDRSRATFLPAVRVAAACER
jgi:hypothetical protein